MTFRIIFRTAGILGALALCIPLANASGTVTYNTVASFDSAVSSGFQPLNVANFDSIVSGTLIPNGTSVGGGVTLSYAPYAGGAFEMDVISGLATTSPPNYLGSTVAGGPAGGAFDAFTSGDQITMTFSTPQQAVGLFLITSSPNNQPSDFTLSTSQGSGNIGGVDPAFAGLVAGGTDVYFLGLVDNTPGQTFTTATLSSDATNNFPFNVDDIVTTTAATSNSVPDESSTLGLLLSAGAGLMSLRGRRRP
jgi:hypothetical protein